MLQASMKHSGSTDRTRHMAGIALAALALVFVALVIVKLRDAAGDGDAVRNTPVIDTPQALESLTQAQVELMQQQAAQAAAEATGLPPLQGPVTERPGYVSEVEWYILREVAAQGPDPDATLTRLVNKLRFSKQVELWQQATGAQRTALAQQLLADIPSQVKQGDLDRATAQQLQAQLLGELVSDPVQRRTRLAEEAARIGVTFEIE